MVSRCRICRFEMVLDDLAVAGDTAWLACLRCSLRETGAAVPMPKWLWHELTSVLAGVSA